MQTNLVTGRICYEKKPIAFKATGVYFFAMDSIGPSVLQDDNQLFSVHVGFVDFGVVVNVLDVVVVFELVN